MLRKTKRDRESLIGSVIGQDGHTLLNENGRKPLSWSLKFETCSLTLLTGFSLNRLSKVDSLDFLRDDFLCSARPLSRGSRINNV